MSVNFAAAAWWAGLPFRHRFCVSSNKKVSLKHLTNLINFHFITEINLFQMTFWKVFGFFFLFFSPSSFNCWLKIVAALNIYNTGIKFFIWNCSRLILLFFLIYFFFKWKSCLDLWFCVWSVSVSVHSLSPSSNVPFAKDCE